jgi:hypothetical protein
VILITLVDLAAYIPTFRKSYHCPHEERVFMFAVMLLRNAASIYALTVYTPTTILFPLLTGLANILLIAVIASRRMMVAPQPVTIER